MNKPCISQYLEVFSERNGSTAIFNKLSKKTYSIGKNEYSVLKILDGTKTIDQLNTLFEIYSIYDLERLIIQFEKIGFIKGKEPKQKLNILKIKKGVMNPNKVINPDNKLVKALYFILVYLSVPLLLFGLISGADDFNLFAEILTDSITSPSILILIPTLLLVISLHELGHAIVARCNGVNVAEFGVMLYWFMPCGYTNLSGIAFIERKSRRLLILFAGILVNINLAGIGLLCMRLVTGSGYEFLLWFVVSNLLSVFMNLLVFLKLDGYYILQELIGEKKLRENSFLYLKTLLPTKTRDNGNSLYRGEWVDNPDQTRPLTNSVYLVYGFLSILFIPILSLSMISTVLLFI